MAGVSGGVGVNLLDGGRFALGLFAGYATTLVIWISSDLTQVLVADLALLGAFLGAIIAGTFTIGAVALSEFYSSRRDWHRTTSLDRQTAIAIVSKLVSHSGQMSNLHRYWNSEQADTLIVVHWNDSTGRWSEVFKKALIGKVDMIGLSHEDEAFCLRLGEAGLAESLGDARRAHSRLVDLFYSYGQAYDKFTTAIERDLEGNETINLQPSSKNDYETLRSRAHLVNDFLLDHHSEVRASLQLAISQFNEKLDLGLVVSERDTPSAFFGKLDEPE
jgi:hypothetical protein